MASDYVKFEVKSRLHCALHFAVGFPFFGGGAFVVGFLTSGRADEDFDSACLEIHFKGDDGETFVLFCFLHGKDLFFVKEQFSLPPLFVVVDIAELVGRDVGELEKGFAAGDVDVRFDDTRTFFANRLDFGTCEHNSRLKRLENLVVVPRFFVLGNILHGLGVYRLKVAIARKTRIPNQKTKLK